MTVADLLARASGRELQAWQQFFRIKAQREKQAQKDQEFMGADTTEVASMEGLFGIS